MGGAAALLLVGPALRRFKVSRARHAIHAAVNQKGVPVRALDPSFDLVAIRNEKKLTVWLDAFDIE